MTKEDYIKMIDSLFNEYDAFYFANKYCDNNLNGNTHEYELNNLFDLFKDDPTSTKALNWIQNCYDCYYKEEFKNDDSAFAYLKQQIESRFNNERI